LDILKSAVKRGTASQSRKAGLEKLEIVLSASAFWRGGRNGVRGEFDPPSQLIKSIQIFSNTLRQIKK